MISKDPTLKTCGDASEKSASGDVRIGLSRRGRSLAVPPELRLNDLEVFGISHSVEIKVIPA
jgi:hypothetical protein